MDEYHKIFPKDDEYRQRFTTESSEFYYNKMMKLIDDDRSRIDKLQGWVPGLMLPNHLMYRIDTLHSADGRRLYEFLIEYNTKKPAEGIYYGCRGITIEGFDHDFEIEKFRQDFDFLKGALCQALNNIFPDMDFTQRLKMTDNANTNTYWLFWISLYEDEDIKEVGLVATKKIRDVFKLYLDGTICEPIEPPSSKSLFPRTAFFQSNYDALLSSVKEPQKFEKLLQYMEDEGWIVASALYEKAWIFVGEEEHNLNVDFIAIMKVLAEHHYFKGKKGAVCWSQLEDVFLNCEGNANRNLRQQAIQYKNDRGNFWKEKMKKILQKLE